MCLAHVYSTINLLNETDISNTAVYVNFILYYQYHKYIFYLILKAGSMKKRYTVFIFIFLIKLKFYFFNFIFILYKIVLVLPNIKMNPPQVYMCSLS